MLPLAIVRHAIPHRTRLKIPAQRGQDGYFRHLGSALGAYPGIAEVEVDPTTASLLLQHDAPLDEIVAFAEKQALFSLSEDIPAKAPISHFLLDTVRRVDHDLRHASSGQLDLREAGLLLLFALALYQGMRGHLLGPTSTLLWSAIGLLVAAGRRPSGEPDGQAEKP